MKNFDLNLESIDINALKVFYFTHNKQQTCKEFNLCLNQLNNILEKLQLTSITALDKYILFIEHKYSKDFFMNYYLNNSIDKVIEYFQLKNTRNLYKILDHYNVSKYNYSSESSLNPSEILSYYNTHSKEETAKYFNISKSSLYKILKENNLEKNNYKIVNISKRISKEELSNYYLSHSHTDTCAYFSQKYTTKFNTIKSLLKYYNIDKKNNLELNIKKDISENDDLIISDIAKKYNLSYCGILRIINKYNLRDKIIWNPMHSSYESEIRSYLDSLNVEYKVNFRGLLSNNKELDIYCPDYNIAIEFNGNYWHSELFKDRNYHFNKAKECRNKNIRLIQIYQYEWDDPTKQHIIRSMLKIAFNKVEEKIYARKCEVRCISNAEAKIFNNENHLQGHRNAQVTYGLFYKNKLVQLMSFSNSKYNKNLNTNDSWEIIRGCPGSNNIVIGGVSKLLTHFIKEHQPLKIFSYCDFNKFNGAGYEAAGMLNKGYTGPDFVWVDKNNQVYSRNPYRRKEFLENDLLKIFRAGSIKYELVI